MEHRAKRKCQRQGKRLHALNPILRAPNASLQRRVRLSTKAVILLVSIQVLFLIFSPQKAQAQGVVAHEIPKSAERLDGIERQLISIDTSLTLLEEDLIDVTRGLGVLKAEEEKPKSLLKRLL
ncbi:hypothetical protein KA005_24415, partial [bacterium]|nr:hypothetical protein [bacterium]